MVNRTLFLLKVQVDKFGSERLNPMKQHGLVDKSIFQFFRCCIYGALIPNSQGADLENQIQSAHKPISTVQN
jgi:hypothetical protein